jgi:hypothetical protein
MLRWIPLLIVGYLAGCGGRGSPPASSSQHELDQRHCTSNSDCASGYCADGRCG